MPEPNGASPTNQAPANDAASVQQKASDTGTQGERQISLSEAQYDALLDQIAELEAVAAQSYTPKGKRGVTDLDTLAEEARRGKPSTKEKPANLDDMSNTEIVSHIIDLVNEQGGKRIQQIEMAVEALRVTREIDKLEAKHEDFWDYHEEIKEKAMANPSLSLEEVYRLVKSEAADKKPAKGKDGEEPPLTRTEKLLRLPPRVHGERPGPASATTLDSVAGKTLKSAAARAWDEVVGKGKAEV